MVQYGDPAIGNPKAHTIGDPSIALAAQGMFAQLKQAQPKPAQQGMGTGLGEPGPSHGKN